MRCILSSQRTSVDRHFSVPAELPPSTPYSQKNLGRTEDPSNIFSKSIYEDYVRFNCDDVSSHISIHHMIMIVIMSTNSYLFIMFVCLFIGLPTDNDDRTILTMISSRLGCECGDSVQYSGSSETVDSVWNTLNENSGVIRWIDSGVCMYEWMTWLMTETKRKYSDEIAEIRSCSSIMFTVSPQVHHLHYYHSDLPPLSDSRDGRNLRHFENVKNMKRPWKSCLRAGGNHGRNTSVIV